MSLSARQLAQAIELRDGTPALVRAIRADDRVRLQTAFLALDPESVYLRYFAYKRELTAADLDRMCQPDFAERVVLVVTVGAAAEEVIIGSGGYVVHAATDGARVAEVAFAVEEDFQGQGIAGKLLSMLSSLARDDGIAHFEAEVLARNTPMLAVFARSGLPTQKQRGADGVVTLSMSLLNPA